MPLVRVDLQVGRAEEELATIGDAVHEAMVETIGVPADDASRSSPSTGRDGSATTGTTSASAATTGSCWSRSPWPADARSRRKRRLVTWSPERMREPPDLADDSTAVACHC